MTEEDLLTNNETHIRVPRKVLIELAPDISKVLDELTAPGSPIVESQDQLIAQCLKDALNPLPHLGFWVFTLRFKQQLEELLRRVGE